MQCWPSKYFQFTLSLNMVVTVQISSATRNLMLIQHTIYE